MKGNDRGIELLFDVSDTTSSYRPSISARTASCAGVCGRRRRRQGAAHLRDRDGEK